MRDYRHGVVGDSAVCRGASDGCLPLGGGKDTDVPSVMDR